MPNGDRADVLAGHKTINDSGAHDAIWKIDKVVEEERGAGAQAPEPVFADDEAPRDGTFSEIGFLEECSIGHAQTEEDDEEGENGTYAVDGVESHFQIVVRGQEGKEIDECAGGGTGCGHHGRDEDLDGSSLLVEGIGGPFECGGCGSGIFASDAYTCYTASDGEEPKHV